MTDVPPSEVSGRIFDIQRFSINDGPGIRTTVFLKGCPLRCLWCHNPEGLSGEVQLSFDPSRCIGCGFCMQACPHSAHRAGQDGPHVLDRSRCTACGACAEQCYAGALEVVGRDVTVAEALAEVRKDEPFYETSGGGMTLSGGEPTRQIDFTAALLAEAKACGLHTAVETCGFAAPDRFDRILAATDLFLFDLKAADDAAHRELTGVPLAPILANLRRLHDAGAAIWLRCPLVGGLNVSEAHFQRIAQTVRDLPNIRKVHVLPYHPLAESKYERLAMPTPIPPRAHRPTDEEVRHWLRRLADLGVPAEIA